MSQQEVNKLEVERNKQWIQKQMNKGSEAIDIGLDYDRRLKWGYAQHDYEMERTATKEYKKYNKVFESTSVA